MATNYDINYNDKRFTEVEADKKAALNEVDVTYGNMISNTDKYYQKQIDAAKNYGETQKKNQQAQTDFAIKEIEQQKAQAKKDYTKEQSGAYVDWQKQSNDYGVNAEKAAANGMSDSGFTANLENSLYNTWQNRVATAREAYVLAVQGYDNYITQARLQNNAVLAEIAYNTLQKQLELSLQGFQHKNQLIIEKANQKRAIDETYYGRYQDVLAQINTENALAEKVRQYNESLEEQKRQADMANARQKEQIKIAQAELQLQRDKFSYQKAQDAEAKSYSEKAAKAAENTKKAAKQKATTQKLTTQEKKIQAADKKSTAKGSTYSIAAANLRAQGVTTGDGGLMTESEWKRRKRSGSNRAELAFATYKDYVNSFSNWRLANPEK